MDMGRNSQAVLDTNVFDPDATGQETLAVADTEQDVQDIQQALLEGEDPTVFSEAPAAGPVGDASDGGSSFVSRDYLNPDVTPTSGFDTAGSDQRFVDDSEDLNLLALGGIPNAGLTTVLLDEDDLGSAEPLALDDGASTAFSSFISSTLGISGDFKFNTPHGVGDERPEIGDNVGAPNARFSGSLVAGFGPDGPSSESPPVRFNATTGSPVIDASGDAVTSGGNPVQYWVSGDGETLIGFIVRDGVTDGLEDLRQFESSFVDIIFVAQLSSNATGAGFTAALHGQLDHAKPDYENGELAFENNLFINLGFTITDGNGDSANGVLQLNIDDDSPVYGETETTTVNEDALGHWYSDGISPQHHESESSFNFREFTHNFEALFLPGYSGALSSTGNPGDTYNPEDESVETAITNGNLDINWGADDDNDGGEFDRSVSFVDDQQAPENLTSGGKPVHYVVSGSSLLAYTGELPLEGPVVTPQSIDGFREDGRGLEGENTFQPIFAIQLNDQGSGSYDFILLGPIDHPESNEEDDVELTFDFFAVDSDGDYASNQEGVPTSDSFTVIINDDAPSVTVDEDFTVPSMLLDESTVPVDEDPVVNDGVNDGIRSVTEGFAAAFGETIDYGADGQGGVEYSLLLDTDADESSDGNYINSGLFALDPDNDAAIEPGKGEQIQLTLTAGENTDIVIGEVGGQTYFTLSLNKENGEITFTQTSNIWHPVAGDNSEGEHDDAVKLKLEDGLLALQQTVTDGDGDSDADNFDLGAAGAFIIEDDGPTANRNTPEEAVTLTLDESPVDGGDGLRSDKADFSVYFVTGSDVDYGSDGAGSVSYNFALNLHDEESLESGLHALDSEADDGQGDEIELTSNDDNTVISGKAGDVTYFTLTLDSENGEIEFEQFENIWHPIAGDNSEGEHDDAVKLKLEDGLLALQQTVTDGDGDFDTAIFDLGAAGAFSIEDDGPTVTAEPLDDATPNEEDIAAAIPDAAAGNQSAEEVSTNESRPLVVDETVGFRADDSNADDENNPDAADGAIGYASVAASDLFRFNVDAGTDGESDRMYTLSLNFENEDDTDVSSGLLVSGDAEAGDRGISLTINDDETVVTGEAAGEDGSVFTIEIDPESGQVTVNQFKAIDHGELGVIGDAAVFMNAGVLAGKLTVFDNDGDSASAQAELGRQIAFEDDAPIANDNAQSVVAGKSVDGNVLDNDIGQDGPLTLTSIQYRNSDMLTFKDDAETDEGGHFISLETDNGTLKIYNDGEYRYEAKPVEITTVSISAEALLDSAAFGFNDGDHLDDGKLDLSKLSDATADNVKNNNGDKSGLGVNLDQAGTIDDGEHLIIGLDTPVKSASVGINQFNANQSDKGEWTAFDAEGNEVGSGTFEGENTNGKVFSLNIETDTPFSYLAFGQDSGNTSNQGYVVDGVTYNKLAEELAPENFTYIVEDADGTSASADLTIEIGESTAPDFEPLMAVDNQATAGLSLVETTSTNKETYVDKDFVSEYTFDNADGEVIVSDFKKHTFWVSDNAVGELKFDVEIEPYGSLYWYVDLGFVPSEPNGRVSANSDGTVTVSGLEPGPPYGYELVMQPSISEKSEHSTTVSSITISNFVVTNVITTTDVTTEVDAVRAAEGNVISDNAEINGTGENDTIGELDYTLNIQDAGNFVAVNDTDDGTTVAGNYGELKIFADGSYTYRPNGDAGNVGKTDSFNYQLEAEDGRTSEASLDIKIGHYEEGTDGDDRLQAEDNHLNILVGGEGDDTLIGLDGAQDIFVWNDGDEGDDQNPADDVVQNFNTADNDVLDISDLLQDEESDDADITEYIKVEEAGDDVVITLSPNGDGENGESQIIKLEGQSFSSLGVTDSNNAVNELITSGAIKVDES